ncbi:MFS transporter [Colletotrichum karsti]|uniref:MFS transporter n=1 Tax=Colletotrichum karsti TaxID=1095194 RepID=A0A9P6HWQ3_9PEZI|nr:MFS transporter [Colletotrichum karsti]KAF9871779.1 MFS transporter [Colletotrichum karsti]
MSVTTSTEKMTGDQPLKVSTSGIGDVCGTESDSATDARRLETRDFEADGSTGKRGKSVQQTVAVGALTLGLCLVAFAAAVDNTILAEFNSLEDAGLYRSASLVASTALQLPYGKAYAQFNVKWIYLASLLIFEAGSVLCAAAPSSRALIAGRVVSGVGAAALYSGAINMLAMAASPQRTPALFGTLSSMFGLASLVGPLLGGAFTDAPNLTWRWCFWINLPLGGVAAIFILLVFRIPKPSSPQMPTHVEADTEMQTVNSTQNDAQDMQDKAAATTTTRTTAPAQQPHTQEVPASKFLSFIRKVQKMDPLGTALLIPAMVSLVLALQWGGTTYPWSDGRVWGCLVCFGVLAGFFVLSLRFNGDEAVIPLRLLRDRTVLGGVLMITWLSAGFFTHVFFLPFYLQVVQGMSATASGLRLLAYLGAMALAGVVAGGAMSSRRGGGLSNHKPYAWVGAGLFIVGAGLLHTLSVTSGLGKVVGFQLLSGAALGIAWQVPYIAVQRSEKLAKRPGDGAISNALITFSNSFGAVLGISIAQNIFARTLTTGLAGVPGLDSSHADAIAKAGQAAQLSDPAFLPQGLLVLVLQVFNDAIMSTFTFAAVAGGVGFLCSFIFP